MDLRCHSHFDDHNSQFKSNLMNLAGKENNLNNQNWLVMAIRIPTVFVHIHVCLMVAIIAPVTWHVHNASWPRHREDDGKMTWQNVWHVRHQLMNHHQWQSNYFGGKIWKYDMHDIWSPSILNHEQLLSDWFLNCYFLLVFTHFHIFGMFFETLIQNCFGIFVWKYLAIRPNIGLRFWVKCSAIDSHH